MISAVSAIGSYTDSSLKMGLYHRAGTQQVEDFVMETSLLESDELTSRIHWRPAMGQELKVVM